MACHAATTKHTDLVMIPLQMALWQRDREGHRGSPATVARKLSALSGFYDYGVHLAHSPTASVRRPKVSDESQAVGLTADQLRLLLLNAAQHSTRPLALVSLLTFCGLRISEALNADIRDYGHCVLKVTRKGGMVERTCVCDDRAQQCFGGLERVPPGPPRRPRRGLAR